MSKVYKNLCMKLMDFSVLSCTFAFCDKKQPKITKNEFFHACSQNLHSKFCVSKLVFACLLVFHNPKTLIFYHFKGYLHFRVRYYPAYFSFKCMRLILTFFSKFAQSKSNLSLQISCFSYQTKLKT